MPLELPTIDYELDTCEWKTLHTFHLLRFFPLFIVENELLELLLLDPVLELSAARMYGDH